MYSKYHWPLQNVMLFVLIKDMTFIMIPIEEDIIIITFSMVNVSFESVDR